jgi:hypothetical protein
MITVKATREGRIGHRTSTGYIVDTVVAFVALPAVAALRQWVEVTNPRTGKATRAIVLDVGPWNEQDNAYVFDGDRPAAESRKDERGRITNGAGIDLGEKVWRTLGMVDDGLVSWRFVP